VRRLWRSPLTVGAQVVILAFIVTAVFGQGLVHFNEHYTNLSATFLPPSRAHLLGTDDLGRDMLVRIIAGARDAAEIVVVVLAIAVSIGVILGAWAGYAGGVVDEAIMRVTDIFLAFPALLLAIAVAAALGPGLVHAMMALAVIWWPWYARMVRGQVLSVKNEDFVEAARALGAPRWQLLWKHVLPNSIFPVVIQLTLDVGVVILTAAGLGFLGLGAQPPSPDWGLLISDGQQYMLNQWWIATFPGIAIFLVVMAFNLLGDALRDIADVRTRSQ
jgi:peptide/nickel transport system permease protein